MSKAEELREYFDFTEEDLNENSQGRVTEDQISLIKIGIQNEMTRYLVVLLVTVVALFLVGINSSGTSNKTGTPLVGIAILLLGLIGFSIFRYNKRSDFSLQSVEGKVNFIWVRTTGNSGGGSSNNTLKLRVDGQSFDVRKELTDILENGDRCRFYYTAGRDIISAEFLGKSKD